MKLWDARSFALERTFKPPEFVIRAALSADGRTLAGGTDRGLRIWNARSGRQRRFVPDGEVHGRRDQPGQRHRRLRRRGRQAQPAGRVRPRQTPHARAVPRRRTS